MDIQNTISTDATTAPVVSAQEFATLFSRFREPFVNISFSYIHDRSAAEDIVSDCFASFWDKRNEIQLNSPPEAYLLTAVKNRSLNFLRDQATRMRIEQKMQTNAYRALMAEIDVLDGQDMSILFKEEVRHIFEDFMKSMPKMTRDIFYSSRFEDLTYDEIAEKYGVSTRKVKREIQRVLSAMRSSLKDYLPIATLLFCLYDKLPY